MFFIADGENNSQSIETFRQRFLACFPATCEVFKIIEDIPHLERRTDVHKRMVKIKVNSFTEFVGVMMTSEEALLEAINEFRKKIIHIMDLFRSFVTARRFFIIFFVFLILLNSHIVFL